MSARQQKYREPLTRDAAAELLGVSTRTITRRADSGDLERIETEEGVRYRLRATEWTQAQIGERAGVRVVDFRRDARQGHRDARDSPESPSSGTRDIPSETSRPTVSEALRGVAVAVLVLVKAIADALLARVGVGERGEP